MSKYAILLEGKEKKTEFQTIECISKEKGVTNMTIRAYIECCKKFAEDSKSWYTFDIYKFYTTDNYSWDWKETCDNAHGGLDVSWAFHMDTADIEKYAPEEFRRSVAEDLLALADNGADYDVFVNRIRELLN